MWLDNFDLNQTANFYYISQVNDGMGGVSKTTHLRASIKCAIWQNGQSNSKFSDRIHNTSTFTLVCKPRSDIAATDYVKAGNKVYKITQPDDILDLGDLMQIGMEYYD